MMETLNNTLKSFTLEDAIKYERSLVDICNSCLIEGDNLSELDKYYNEHNSLEAEYHGQLAEWLDIVRELKEHPLAMAAQIFKMECASPRPCKECPLRMQDDFRGCMFNYLPESWNIDNIKE